MILTLEPGLYLPEEGLGIRIEDDVLVTETGREVLSEALPRRPGGDRGDHEGRPSLGPTRDGRFEPRKPVGGVR